MRRVLGVVLLVWLSAPGIYAQGVVYKPGQVFTVGVAVPPTCTPGGVFILTGSPAIFICTATNVWTQLGFVGGGSSVPSGAILLIENGSCPATYTEASALAGRTLVGTLAASMDVGTTGGADTITPVGTNTVPTFSGAASAVPTATITWPAGVPLFTGNALATHTHTFIGNALATHTHTFTGNALATHAHELPFQIPTTTSIRQIAVGTFGTGTSRAATATQTHTANTTSAAVALSQAVSAGTPAGTNVAITAGTPTGANTAITAGIPGGTITWPAGVPTNSAVNFTPVGTVTAPGFTGTPFDNRSAFVRVIFCRKD